MEANVYPIIFAARKKIAVLDKRRRKSRRDPGLLRRLQLENLIVHCFMSRRNHREDAPSDSSSDENDEPALPLNDISRRKRPGDHVADDQGPCKRPRLLCAPDADPADKDTPRTRENCEQNVPAAQPMDDQHPVGGYACPDPDFADLGEEPVLPPIFAFLND
ncbi:hypothetical protein HPB48_015081 [Haemaphysalis longicornis]|uniref:Uncharacterized protein n=1 Tax=Haemaphysalis longicornis TaxID=44386 RepID=A0A9J6GT10_HAELO|nr:hypothetical protein HPB48_015081 [Haemaphysalis longicornis]